tara:strand:+ start:8047 stop:8208 length:162 start_codon:yes stop_codon:yes gene_type:complete
MGWSRLAIGLDWTPSQPSDQLARALEMNMKKLSIAQVAVIITAPSAAAADGQP